MEKKYKLTKETIIVDNITLYRIKAIRDFSDVKAGDLGGFVEKEDNLSHEGNCWVYDNAKVYNDAKIKDNAKIYNNAKIFGNAVIYDNARIYDNALIFGYSIIYDNVLITDYAKIYDYAQVSHYVHISENAEIYGNSSISDNIYISGNVIIKGNARVFGRSAICGNAIISDSSDYIVFKNWWSSGRYFTWTKSNNMWKVGCFYGTGEELIKKAYNDSELSGREYEKIVNYVNSIINSND